MLLYFTSLAWLCAIFILSGLTWIIPIYFVLAYLALFFAVLSSVRPSRDWLNPLALVLIVGFIRFSVPGLMTLFGVEPSGVPVFYMMGVERHDWVLGHVLGLMGLLGVVTGWLLDLKLPARVLRRIELLKIGRAHV